MRSNSTNGDRSPRKRWMSSMFTFFLTLVTLVATAQQRTVSGVITSGDDGSTLPGVTILEKGTTNGTITDIDGNYKITVTDEDAVLVISFVGFQTREVTVGNQSTISVTMESDVSTLQEVVVVGLWYTAQK